MKLGETMRLILLLILSALFIPNLAMAADFDGSKALICATRSAMECTENDGCQRVSLEDNNVPAFIDVDVAAKMIKDRGNGQSERSSSIAAMKQIDGKLFLQGAEDGRDGVRDGLAWSIAIQDDNGRMVLTASGGDVGFVVFGACVPH
jgi:hypothetical protein